MGKLILEVPAAVNMKLKVGGIPEAIKKDEKKDGAR